MDREDESRKAPPRVALIHALAHSVAPINAEFERAWPECVRMNLLDDSLAADLARDGTGLDARMTERFLALAAYALGTGADGILFTCSAFGACIDAVKARWPAVPVQKPNEAMIAEAVAAVRTGGAPGRIGLVATFAPTLGSMVGEFPPGIELVTEHADGALAALDRSDAAPRQARGRCGPAGRGAGKHRRCARAVQPGPRRTGDRCGVARNRRRAHDASLGGAGAAQRLALAFGVRAVIPPVGVRAVILPTVDW